MFVLLDPLFRFMNFLLHRRHKLFTSSRDSMTNALGRKVGNTFRIFTHSEVDLWRTQCLNWTGLITRNYIGRHGRLHTQSKSQR